MAEDYLTTGEAQEKEKDVRELSAQAADEQLSDAANTTHDSDGEAFEPIENNQPEAYEQVEGDVVPSENPKKEWADDVEENTREQTTEASQQEGSGAFAAARNGWANGWSGMQ